MINALRRLTCALSALAIAAGPVAAQSLAGGPMSRQTAYSQAYGGAAASGPMMAGPTYPMESAYGAGDGGTRVNLSASGGSTQVVSLPRGKSAMVDLPVDARDVLVTNPAVADAVLRSPRRIMVLGVAPGQTDAVFFDAAGRRILSLDIRVDIDSAALNDTVARLVPGSRVRVEAINNSVVLTGEVPNAAASDQVYRLATAYVADPKQVVNMLSIAGKDQVMLKVQIIEVQRTVIKQLGFDLSSAVGQVGQAQFLLGNSSSFGVNGGILGGLNSGYSLDTTTQPIASGPATCEQVIIIDRTNPATCVGTNRAGSTGLNKGIGLIKAFERVGLIRTLAEPNLTALSGESAKFLAGGEYPVPVGRDLDGNVTVQFKPYGVGLGFTPLVLSEGRISLRISTEVSELTTTGAFTLSSPANTSSGATATNVTIPALNVRRAETTVELPSGGAMMIAGLLQDTTRQNIDSVPGMTNMPILGALFRSRDYLKGETELVIIVTPYIAKPSAPGELQTPADGLRTASDMETVLMGKMNKTYRIKEAAVKGRSYQGPYGYVIE